MEGIDGNGEITESARREVTGELRAKFRPEFLNRVDETVLFKPLQGEEIVKIVDLLLESVKSRLKGRNIILNITDAAKEAIARAGYDPVYGARPLKRYIQRELETQLARSLIANEVSDGSSVLVDAHGDGIRVMLSN